MKRIYLEYIFKKIVILLTLSPYKDVYSKRKWRFCLRKSAQTRNLCFYSIKIGTGNNFLREVAFQGKHG